MTGCARCTRHRPDPDGGCTPRCHHPQPAGPGLVLCPACLADLRALCSELARLWCATATPQPGSRAAGGSERPLPGGTEWLDWRTGTDLARDLAAIADEWADAHPGTPGPTRPGVVQLLVWLRAHTDSHGAATPTVVGDMAVMASHVHRGRRLAGEANPSRHIPCPGHTQDSGCGRRLAIDLHDPDRALDPCAWCGRSWTTAQLLRFGDRDVYLDAEAVAATVGVSESTLRRWARRGLVRQSHSRYHLGDAEHARSAATIRG